MTYDFPVYYSTNNSSTTLVYSWSPVYQPAYVPSPFRAYDPVAEGAAIPESDLAWLKRRVDEIRWVPA